MRIGLLIYGDLEQSTGGYIYDRYLVNHLRAGGHEVILIALPALSLAGRLADNFSPLLVGRIRGLDLDILVEDALCLPSLIGLNRVLSLCTRLPKVALVHQLVYRRQRQGGLRRFYAFWEKTFLRSADAIIVNSEQLRRAIREEMGVIRPELVATPGGDRLAAGGVEELENLSRRVEQPGPLKLFFLGNVLPNKGLHKLLKVLKGLDPEIWRLSVAGSLEMDKAYADRIRQFIAVHGLGAQVRLLGLLDRESLKAELAGHHLLTLPYSIEGFGIAYLEGMSLGLPAIGSTRGAAGEIIDHGKNGLLVEFAGDGDDLRGYLSHLQLDRQELKALSLAALDSFQEFPTWEGSMARIRGFLQEVGGC